MFNFHEVAMFQERKREAAEETRDAHIDEMADDLYRAKLQDLPNGRKDGTAYQSDLGYNTWTVLDDLKQPDLVEVGRAIRDNDPALVGMLIIKLVTAQLRKEAQDEADEYDDEEFEARKYA